jgi:hypothetical protein
MPRSTLGSLALVLLSPSFAAAHHSYTEFDDERIVEIAGTLTTVRWQNPHARLVLQTAEGKEWEIETSPLTFLSRSGAPLDQYPVGSSVRVAGWPSKRSDARMYGTNILSSAGRELVLWASKPHWQNTAFIAGRAAPSDAASRAAPKTLFQVWGSIYANADRPADPDASPGALRRVPMPYTEAGRRTLANAVFDDAPALGCKPKGMWTIMNAPTPMDIVDRGDQILVRIEEFDSVRTIHMRGAQDPATQPRTPLGYSVGRWDGETLVVDTTRLGGGWIELGPDAHLVERFTAGDDGRLHYSLTISDPMNLTQPVEQKRSWVATPGVELMPYDCKPYRD